jgi:hypothetical protein
VSRPPATSRADLTRWYRRAADISPVDDASFDVVFNQSRWIIVGSIVAFAIAKHVTRRVR